VAHIQQIIVEAAKPLIDDPGEKNPTAKVMNVWSSIPGQGEPKDKKERVRRIGVYHDTGQPTTLLIRPHISRGHRLC
jgi:hypothetical protein